MPTDTGLIAAPVLDDAAEKDRIAARIHRSIRGLSVQDAELIIAYGESLKEMLLASGAVSDPLLPELSSARPAEAHVVLLTETERAFTETHYRFNELPESVLIANLNLMGKSLLPAVAASCTLQFTKIADFLNIEVTVFAGTIVASGDHRIVVTTDTDLVIPAGDATGAVTAKATTEGDVRATANSIGLPLTSLAGILSVTNTTALSGGSPAETVEQGKIRAREEWRIGRHLGSVKDFEDYVYFEVLRRKGRVTGFERMRGDFSPSGPGYALIVVQGADGLAPQAATLEAVAAVISERHVASLSVAARGPLLKPFNIAANVTIAPGASAPTLINKATANLFARFNPLSFEYGPAFPNRFIDLSDIVGQIEAASPNLISVRHTGNAFDITLTINGVEYQQDIPLGLGEMPLLGTVTMTVV